MNKDVIVLIDSVGLVVGEVVGERKPHVESVVLTPNASLCATTSYSATAAVLVSILPTRK